CHGDSIKLLFLELRLPAVTLFQFRLLDQPVRYVNYLHTFTLSFFKAISYPATRKPIFIGIYDHQHPLACIPYCLIDQESFVTNCKFLNWRLDIEFLDKRQIGSELNLR